MKKSSLKKLKNFLRRKIIQYFRGGYFAINDLDKKLESFLPHRNGFYVELGANNGYDQSNSYYFELKKGWRGVLVEPLINKYKECTNIRSQKNMSLIGHSRCLHPVLHKSHSCGAKKIQVFYQGHLLQSNHP